jgi:hypothetical protein
MHNPDWSMIRKSGNRFSEKIMLKQENKAGSDLTQLNQTLVSPKGPLERQKRQQGAA